MAKGRSDIKGFLYCNTRFLLFPCFTLCIEHNGGLHTTRTYAHSHLRSLAHEKSDRFLQISSLFSFSNPVPSSESSRDMATFFLMRMITVPVPDLVLMREEEQEEDEEGLFRASYE
jgi:hypothetical protein